MSKEKKQIVERLFYKNVALTKNLSDKGDVSVDQLKAARSLLNWSQADLAQKSGYSLPTINNIERGQYKAHSATMDDIIQTFEQAGIQFIDGPGVKIENTSLQIKAYEGSDALHYLFTKIGLALTDSNDILYMSGLDEVLLKAGAKEEDIKTLFRRLKEIDVRILCHKGQRNAFGFPKCKTKVVDDTIPLIPYFLYKNRLTIVILQNPIHVAILYNDSLAEVHKSLFEYLWKISK